MHDDGPRPRDVVVALALAGALLLAGALAGQVAARIAGELMPGPTAEEAARFDLTPVYRVILVELVISTVGLVIGAFAGGRLAVRRLLGAGADPGPLLYLFAALPPVVLSALVAGGRVVTGVPGDELAFGLVLDATAVAGALLGCWWASRRWRASAGGDVGRLSRERVPRLLSGAARASSKSGLDHLYSERAQPRTRGARDEWRRPPQPAVTCAPA
jgi:hypothetical protein